MYLGRYLILCMGIMAIFTGFMYNECFSLSMGIMKSGFYTKEIDGTLVMQNKTYTYPIGVDPVCVIFFFYLLIIF
jgi:V-type H+-transporting ATPase subunit a